MESMSIKEKIKKKKFKIKKKWLIIGGVILVVAIVLLIGLNKSRAEQSGLTFSDTTVLALSDIQDTVNTTGTVESASSMTVYSTLAYTVKAVNVEVGDYVEKGALLAELDGDAIADQIESQEAAIGVSSNASAEQIKSAQDNYNAAKYALENGLNAAIISAESQVQITYDNYLATQENYARYEDGLDEGENSSLLSAQAARNTAKMNLESAEDAYDLAKAAYDAAKLARDNKQSELDEANDERAAINSGGGRYHRDRRGNRNLDCGTCCSTGNPGCGAKTIGQRRTGVGLCRG